MLARLQLVLDRAREENIILERNGATVAATARAALLADIAEALASPAGEMLTVEEAAHAAGVSIETVRRAVRNGELPDYRSNPRGTIRIRAEDIPFLKGKARVKASDSPATGYDPAAHARALLSQ